MPTITPDMSYEDTLKLVQGMPRKQIPNPLSTQQGGFVQGGGSPGPIQSAVAPPAPQSGPTIYAPAAPPPTTGGIGSTPFNMGSYLDSKLGANAPQVRSITPTAGGVQSTSLGGAGGSGSVNYAPILKSVVGAFQKANAANEGRYNEAKDTLAGFGNSYTNQINENFAQDSAKQEQDATSRGLGNSTIRSALVGGARRRQQDALLGLNDRLAAQKINLLQSKYDNAPSADYVTQLLMQATQANTPNIGSILKSLGYAG